MEIGLHRSGPDDLGPFGCRSFVIYRAESELDERGIINYRDKGCSDRLSDLSPEHGVAFPYEISLSRMTDSLVGKDSAEFRIKNGFHDSSLCRLCIKK